MSASFVYFIGAEGDRVKIGVSRDVGQRLRALQTGASRRLNLLRTLPGGRPLEKWLHAEFAHLRLTGEWFSHDPRMLDIVPPAALPEHVRQFPDVNETAARLHRWIAAGYAAKGPIGRDAALLAVSAETGLSRRRVLSFLNHEAVSVWADEHEAVKAWFLTWSGARADALREEAAALDAERSVIAAEDAARIRAGAASERYRALKAEIASLETELATERTAELTVRIPDPRWEGDAR